MLDGVRVGASLELGPRRVQESDRFVDVDSVRSGLLNPAFRSGDEIFRGLDEFAHQLFCGRVERREDGVHVIEVPPLEGQLGGAQALFGPRDVDVRLTQVLDELLDRNELRRGAAGLL